MPSKLLLSDGQAGPVIELCESALKSLLGAIESIDDSDGHFGALRWSAHTLTVQCIVRQPFEVFLTRQPFAQGELSRRREVRSREANRNRAHRRTVHQPANSPRPAALFGNIAQTDILIANSVESRQLFCLLFSWPLRFIDSRSSRPARKRHPFSVIRILL
jgi:hypothetical protein